MVVPPARWAGWGEVKDFANAVAKHVAGDDPKTYLATMSKSKRKGRVYVDYLRNSRGATSVAPYSTRAREGAPVSMPLEWSELKDIKTAADYNVANTLERLSSKHKSPWSDFHTQRQQLTPSRIKQMQN